jgi:hypothetical protein
MKLMIILEKAANMILGMKWMPITWDKLSILIISVLLKFILELGPCLGDEGCSEDNIIEVFEVYIKT